ncbi:hypothetical protein BN1080_00971 [Planococcus massiliensis]|uniref:Uncharacterized protein n=1 Tax=Planococcus massiliensis TaxID=1499687 RepID=A0A098ELA3_9BACL|nr:hypothetical protein BN1080_00971 [Planococcus massiliensis]
MKKLQLRQHRVRSKSLYATAGKHQVIAAAVIAGAGSLIWNAAFKGRYGESLFSGLQANKKS